jgi:hypothetical protein
VKAFQRALWADHLFSSFTQRRLARHRGTKPLTTRLLSFRRKRLGLRI